LIGIAARVHGHVDEFENELIDAVGGVVTDSLEHHRDRAGASVNSGDGRRSDCFIAQKAVVARSEDEPRGSVVDNSNDLSGRDGIAAEVRDGPTTNELIGAGAVTRATSFSERGAADGTARVSGSDGGGSGDLKVSSALEHEIIRNSVEDRRGHIHLGNGLGDTLAVAASISGGPGANNEEFIGAGAVLSLDAEVDDRVGVAVVRPSD